jgi:hypothetical protein
MVSNFLRSSSHNLKYIGIDSLAAVVAINPKYAQEQQMAVIDCLEVSAHECYFSHTLSMSSYTGYFST